MERQSKCKVTFNNKHQSEYVVIESEETIVSDSPDLAMVPSFTLN